MTRFPKRWELTAGKWLYLRRTSFPWRRMDVCRISRGPNGEAMLDNWAPSNVLPTLAGVRILWRRWYIVVRFR